MTEFEKLPMGKISNLGIKFKVGASQFFLIFILIFICLNLKILVGLTMSKMLILDIKFEIEYSQVRHFLKILARFTLDKFRHKIQNRVELIF